MRSWGWPQLPSMRMSEGHHISDELDDITEQLSGEGAQAFGEDNVPSLLQDGLREVHGDPGGGLEAQGGFLGGGRRGGSGGVA